MRKVLLPKSLRESVLETVKCHSLSGLFAFGILYILPLYIDWILLYYVGGILFLMPVLASSISKWIPKERISVDGKAVFITGCDRGFGYMLAERLDKIGFQVFAGCLLPNAIGAASLRKSGSNRLHIVETDVTDDISVQKAVAYVKENLKENVLWAIVNNAGVAESGEIGWNDMEAIRRVSEVNTMGVVRVTKAFLPMLKESKGRVLAVASIAGRYTFPGLVAYSMSKNATISFCDGLRQEMYKWDVQVITVEPAIYRTAMLSEDLFTNAKRSWEKAPIEVKDMYPSDCVDKHLKKISFLSKFFSKHPSEVASVMEDGITSLQPQHSYSTGNFSSWFIVWLLQRLPKPVSDMMTWFSILFTEI